jgi:outer membrane protein OmpA-like peptidoglycan-associated protein
MARNRLNPWPSVADLFSALTVVAFAALIVIAVGAVVLTQVELDERQTAKELAETFQENYQQKRGEMVQVAPCEDRKSDECIEIEFRFKRNSAALEPSGEAQVEQACEIYKSTVGELSERMQHRHMHLRLVIEGNTDSTVPPKIADPRSQYLFNWTLSSARAISVVYEFHQRGVSPENGFDISSVGWAATRPLCKDSRPDEKCHEQNRRTTMRIRVEHDDNLSNSNS